MKKEVKIIFVILIIILLEGLGWGIYHYYPDLLPRSWRTAPMPTGALPESLKDATLAEKERVWGKTYAELGADFEQEKKVCLERVAENSLKEILSSDRVQAVSLASCQAVKRKDVEICGALKTDERSYNACREMAATQLNFVFPMFEKKDCSSGDFSEEQKAVCSGVISGEASDCEKISNSSIGKPICLAVAQNNISLCDSAQNKQGCQDFFYFAKAVKENQRSYMDNIKSGTNFALYSLFFDKEASCPDLLKKSNESYCAQIFSDEAFSRRVSIWGELNKLKTVEQN